MFCGAPVPKHLLVCAAAALIFGSLASPAPSTAADLAARGHRHLFRTHPIFLRHPSVDAVRLSTLAPLSPRSTAEQTYGDASIARSRAQDRFRERTIAATAPYPCDPHVAFADGHVCANVPGQLGYGQYYAFTPAAVTAPQTAGADPSAQTSLLPPPTSLFLSANSFLFGSHE